MPGEDSESKNKNEPEQNLLVHIQDVNMLDLLTENIPEPIECSEVHHENSLLMEPLVRKIKAEFNPECSEVQHQDSTLLMQPPVRKIKVEYNECSEVQHKDSTLLMEPPIRNIKVEHNDEHSEVQHQDSSLMTEPLIRKIKVEGNDECNEVPHQNSSLLMEHPFKKRKVKFNAACTVKPDPEIACFIKEEHPAPPIPLENMYETASISFPATSQWFDEKISGTSFKVNLGNKLSLYKTMMIGVSVNNLKRNTMATRDEVFNDERLNFHLEKLINNKKFVTAIRYWFKFHLQRLSSFEELLFEMRLIVGEYGYSGNDSLFIVLITIARISNESILLSLISKHSLPVSFILNFCKRIAIIRFILFTGEPIEYGLSIGMSIGKSASRFFHSVNIKESQIVYFKIFDGCGSCSACLNEGGAANKQHLLLPIRFPSTIELLNILQKERILRVLFHFSEVITMLYSKFPQRFRLIEGVNNAFKSCQPWPAVEFVVKEYKKLQEVCSKIFEYHGCIEALGLSKIPLIIDEKIQANLDMVKLICYSVEGLQSDSEMEDSSSSKRIDLAASFQLLSHDISNNNEIEDYIKCVLSNFVNEISLNAYCLGRENLNYFKFLNYPSALINLGGSPESVENFRKIFNLSRKFIKEKPQKVLADLRSFGKFLVGNFPDKYMSLGDILETFHNNQRARLNFPLSLALYNIVGTLPFYSAKVERSMYSMWDMYGKFLAKFGDKVALDLTMVHYKEQNGLDIMNVRQM